MASVGFPVTVKECVPNWRVGHAGRPTAIRRVPGAVGKAERVPFLVKARSEFPSLSHRLYASRRCRQKTSGRLMESWAADA
jgi:hypothetical protein